MGQFNIYILYLQILKPIEFMAALISTADRSNVVFFFLSKLLQFSSELLNYSDVCLPLSTAMASTFHILNHNVFNNFLNSLNRCVRAISAGNSPVTGEFSEQMPVTQNFDVSFDLRLNKRLSKHSWGWWFETPSRSLWRHCHDVETLRQRRAYLLKFITQHKGWCWNSSHITWSNSITCLMMSILPSFSPIVLCWNWYSTEKSPCPRRAHRV